MSFAVTLYTVGLDLRTNCRTIDDQYNTLAESGVLDNIFAFISAGGDIDEVYLQMGLDTLQGDMLLNHTPKSQQKLLAAMANRMAKDSIATLQDPMVKDTYIHSPAKAAGIKHHRDQVKNAIAATSAVVNGEKEDGGNNITVIAHTNIGANQKPPELPPELQGITIDSEDV